MQRSLRDSFTGAIRDVQPSDIEAILAIEENCFPSEERYSRELLQDYLDASLRNPAVPMLIAVPDSSTKGPAGCALGWIEKDGSGEVASLAVTKEYEGHGLGRALLDRVSKSLQEAGANKLVLQVHVDNASAIHLYETSGFVKTKILPKYYGKKDGIEMAKPLKKPAANPQP